MAISGLIITFNEEKNIKDCVKSLFRVCQEVIVIDSFSTDNTVKIAEKLGAKIYLQKFLGDGPQRAYGLTFCKNNWVLNIDADERLDEDTYQFLKAQTYLTDKYDAYSFRMRNFLGGKEINFAGWYPDYTCRFFNKKTARPSSSKVHQHIISNKNKKTPFHLYHYGSNSFFQIISKKNQYTDWQAEQLINSKKKVSFLSPIIHGFFSFFKCYFLEKGILRGLDGLTFSFIQSFFSYMKYAKLIKLKSPYKN